MRPVAARVPNVVYCRPMTNQRMKRLLTMLATFAASAIFAVGCGGDDNDGGGGGDGGGGNPVSGDTTPQDAPESKDEAIDRCFEEARKLEGQAKETAEASCRAAETGDTDDLKEEAKEQCLEAAKQFPEGSARDQAEDACEKVGQ